MNPEPTPEENGFIPEKSELLAMRISHENVDYMVPLRLIFLDKIFNQHLWGDS